MMRSLLPFIRMIRPHLGWVALASLLAIITVLAAIALLGLSGWFLTSTALAGVTLLGARGFNYYTPGAGVRGLAILRTVGRYAERVVSHEATFRILARLRCWCFARIEPLGPAGLARYRSVDLLNRIVSDVSALDNLYLRVLSPTLVALLAGGLVSGFVALYDPGLGWLLACSLLLGGFLLPWLSYRLGAPYGQDLIRYTASLRVQLLDLLQGMAELRVYGGLGDVLLRIRQQQAALYAAQQKMAAINGAGAALMALLSGTTLLLVVWFGFQTPESLGAAQYVMLLFCVLAAFEVVAALPAAYQYLGQTLLAAERLNELVSHPPPVVFPERSATLPGDSSLVLTDVSFGYSPSRPVIQSLSCRLPAGSTAAIVGHTGSGKSSLINMLARFWPMADGEVELGGVALSALSEADLRRHMAVLSQPVQLFSGSVRDNLLMADSGAADERLWQILEVACLDTLLKARQGLETDIGDNGMHLSGGQRKRLALARALLSPAPLLILDEPFEGVDPATEQQLVERLFAVLEGRTLLVITHHLHHLDRFDQVLVMDAGRIVERGVAGALLGDSESQLRRIMPVE